MTTLLPIALSLLLQSAALLLLGLTALHLIRHRGPDVQSLIGRATLAGVGLALLLAAPLTGHIRPLWHVTLPISLPASHTREEPTPPQAASPPAAGRASGKAVGESRLLEGASLAKQPFDSPGEPNAHSATLPSRFGRVAARGGVGFLVTLWGLGTALLLLWVGVCHWHLIRLRRQSRPVTSGPAAEILAALTPHPPILLAHASVFSPFLAGLRRPAIFLPNTYETDFDPAVLRAILAHELAHLARRDTAWTLAARLLCALLWPQPLLWVLCRRLDQIGEEACDQAVLAQDCSPRAYADCLLTLAERHPLGRRERALGAGVTPFRSSLGRRIARILDKGTHAMSTVSPRLRLAIAALTVAAALSGAFLVSSAPAQVALPSSRPLFPASPKSPLIGMWLFRAQPIASNKDTIEIYQANGQFQHVYAGTARHDPQQNFGTFVTNGSKLKWFTTHSSFEDPDLPGYSRILPVNVTDSSLQFGISGGRLTIHDATGEVSVGERVADAAQWGLLQKMLGSEDNVQGKVGEATVTVVRDLLARDQTAHPDTELSNARFLAGLTPVQGPGVVVTLDDSKIPLPAGMPAGRFSVVPNIIHDSDINAVVNELKAAGAEAIAVSDQRLVATSPIRSVGPTVLIDYVPQAPPFVIKAIGNSKAMTLALDLRGGIATQLRGYDPAMVSVREAGMVTLPAFSGEINPRYAKPLSDASLMQEQNQANVDFLNAQIKQVGLHLRAAERALLAFKANHPAQTVQNQRKMADLTRNYASLTELLMSLVKKRQEILLPQRLIQPEIVP